jgi:hypothetical protein
MDEKFPKIIQINGKLVIDKMVKKLRMLGVVLTDKRIYIYDFFLSPTSLWKQQHEIDNNCSK